MKYLILDEQNCIVGDTDDPNYQPPPGWRLTAEIDPAQQRATILAELHQRAAPRLQHLTAQIERFDAARRLSDEAPDPLPLLAAREALWRALERAERELNALEEPEALLAYPRNWAPTAADFPTLSKISSLAFIRRFGIEERERLNVSRADHPALHDWLLQLLLANEVDLADPALIAAVQQLEEDGLIASGRSAQLLARPSYEQSLEL